MLRNRILILVGGCFLAASAAWADDVGYIDCNSHSDDTQVFAKARKSPEVVGTLPCGERFTILVYGFVFSKIQTSDGKVGFIYSSVISADRSATSVQKTSAPRIVASTEKVPNPATGAQPQSASSQPGLTQASVRTTTTTPSERTGAVIDASAPPAAQPQSAPQQTVAAQVATPQAAPAPSFASGATVLEKTVTGAQPDSAAPAPTQPAPAQPEAAQAPAAQPASVQGAASQSAGLPDASVVTSNLAGTPASAPAATSASAPAPAAQPDPPAVQPQPVAAQPAEPQPQPAPARSVEPAVQPVDPNTRWEKPLPSVRQAPLIELFGGYAFARMDGGAGAYSNMNGALGSFGWNWKPWLQLTGDTSYNFITTAGTKYVLYGNHYGARFFHRTHNRWAATPFAEALIGGSREDTTITGPGGYTYSQNCISYKVGGGVDLHPSRRWEIRLVDFDYYRTAFGTNLHQNNYWVSAGVVLRLFGGRGYE
jgi:hypothetical protein